MKKTTYSKSITGWTYGKLSPEMLKECFPKDAYDIGAWFSKKDALDAMADWDKSKPTKYRVTYHVTVEPVK